MNIDSIPRKLRELLGDEPFTVDHIGMSDSLVVLFEDKVLKIQRHCAESQTEYSMLRWLSGKLSVPRCLYHEVRDGLDYLLMSKVPGTMACSEENMAEPERLVQTLAGILKGLWSMDTTDCPVSWLPDRKLALAADAVERGAVDTEHVEPDTFGSDGFESPQALLDWLETHKPPMDPVLSHGDLCLPNVFLEDGRLSGLIDLGRSGVADRWVDIAICYRSLRDNYGGVYGGKSYSGFDPASLFRALDVEPDWEKIRYYLLLDELF